MTQFKEIIDSKANQGQTSEETSITTGQRGGHNTDPQTGSFQDDHQNQARKDAGKDWSDVPAHRPVS